MRRRPFLNIGGKMPITLGYLGGMIMLLDGIENTLTGHDTNITTWVDLSKNGNDLIIPVPAKTTIGSNYVWLNPTSITDLTAMSIIGGLKINNGIVNQFDEFTIEMRFEVGQSISGVYRIIVNADNSPDLIAYIYGNTNNGTLYTRAGGSQISSGLIIYPTLVTISFTYKKATNTVKMYMNGVLFNTQTNIPTNFENIFNSKLYFGDFASLGAATIIKYYSMRIYPFVLTDQEIADNYQNDMNRF